MTATDNAIKVREAIQASEKILTAFLKSGPRSTSHIEDLRAGVSSIISSAVLTPEEATAHYTVTRREFLNRVQQRVRESARQGQLPAAAQVDPIT